MSGTAETDRFKQAGASASTMRWDVGWAYVAAAARIGAAAVVAGVLYRFAGKAEFAMMAMVRGTIGILNYTSLGLAPAMVRLLAEARHGDPKLVLPERMAAQTLEYQTPRSLHHSEPIIFSNGVMVAGISLVIGLLLTVLFAHHFDHWFR